MENIGEQAGGKTVRKGVEQRKSVLEKKFVKEMERLLPAQTNQNLSQLFGIGYHTWVKIKDHSPIRASVAERIRRQLG